MEPFRWFQGVSIWPSSFLRVLAAILAAASFVSLQRQMETNSRELEELFILPSSDNSNSKKIMPWRHLRLPIMSALKTECNGSITIASLWTAYKNADSAWQRFVRVLMMCVLYGIFALILIYFGRPHTPYRGLASKYAANIPLYAGVILQMTLTFYVVDFTCLCRGLVRQLIRSRHIWPAGAASRLSCTEEEADEILTIELIARRTKAVGRMILFPLFVLLLIILSRNFYFARWDWPISLVIIQSGYTLLAFCCSIVLWFSGRSAREWALSSLRDKLLRSKSTGKDGKGIELMIETVRSVEVGAFAPLSAQPLFAAFFLPSGGIGVTMILNYFASIK